MSGAPAGLIREVTVLLIVQLKCAEVAAIAETKAQVIREC